MLAPGSRIASYEVLALLGTGGMGEVYRARDLKLGREVAIKLLPDQFAHDPDRLARFQREAQVLASLNHPNIAAIYGLEATEETKALILELVPGETLSDWTSRRPIPLEEALSIAKQIAEALEAAHEQGIIHRDLKPANVKITPDGVVKVLDFGLAKLAQPAAAATSMSPLTMSPTITSPAMMTGAGMLLGTAGYMSPEQAKGREADKRSDVWALGCVLYEMLTGKRAFEGEDVAETLAAILTKSPDWTNFVQMPRALVRLLQRMLAKQPRQRLGDLSAVRLEITDILAGVAEESSTSSRRGIQSQYWAWIAALAVAIVAGIALAVARPTNPMPLRELRLEVITPPTSDSVSLALSPDGTQLVFVAPMEGRSHLWIRPLNSTVAHVLPRTEAAQNPFWSPDSKAVGFFADGQLRRIDLAEGAVLTLAASRGSTGGTWNQHGTILFSASPASGLLAIPSQGGAARPVVPLTRGQQGHRSPQFLPDGEHFFFFVRGDEATRGIYLGSLDGMAPQRILDGDTAAPVFVAENELFFVRQNTLFVQPFDAKRLSFSGEPTPLAQQVGVDAIFRAALSVSPTGLIAYRATATTNRRQFIWLDRAGKELQRVGLPDQGRPWSPTLSPDSTTVAMHRTDESGNDIWLLDVQRGALTRFTSHPSRELTPVWSPDGSRLAFSRGDTAEADSLVIRDLRDGREEVLHEGNSPRHWTKHFLLFQKKGNSDELAALRWTDHEVMPVVTPAGRERDPQLSPDERWLLFQSSESGASEVYVEAFPNGASKTRVSPFGGAQPRWNPNGREVFFVSLDSRLTSVAINAEPSGTLHVGEPKPLFRLNVGEVVNELTGALYMVSADGQRFLVSTLLDDEAAAPITIILNRPSQR